MFSINKVIPACALIACVIFPTIADAQTIQQIASLQRAKQLAEIEKGAKEAALLTAPASANVVPLVPGIGADSASMKSSVQPKPKNRSNVFVHAIYAKDGIWIAEVSQGQILSVVLPGMVINGSRASAITQFGIEVTKPCTGNRGGPVAPGSCGHRLVRLGEAV